MTSELQQNRYDQLLRRVGGLIGPGSKVSEALTELFPMIDVEDPPGELQILGGTRLAHGSLAATAAALQFPRIQLFNPADSGTLITVTSVIVSQPAVAVVRSTVSQIALTNGVGTELYRDGRLPSPQRPVGQIRVQLDAVQTDATIQFRLSANQTIRLYDDNTVAVLPPGSGLDYGNNTAASTLTISFLWRERPALESELNL